MKEADDGAGSQGAANASSPDKGNGKIDKDMKGLVYQGDVTGSSSISSDTYPAEPTSLEEPKEEKEAGYKGIASPDGEKGDTILNFSEKEGKGKLIVLLVIGIIIIVGIVYVVMHSHITSPKISIPTTTISGNAVTTSVPKNNAKIQILNIDLLYNYTGPSELNNTSCGKTTQSVVESYSNHLNASQTFLLYDNQGSGYCPLTLSKIYSTTPGFKVISITPALPDHIPAHSSIYYIMTLSAPTTNYTGPLSITINEK